MRRAVGGIMSGYLVVQKFTPNLPQIGATWHGSLSLSHNTHLLNFRTFFNSYFSAFPNGNFSGLRPVFLCSRKEDLI
jgi:hypothetical protein